MILKLGICDDNPVDAGIIKKMLQQVLSNLSLEFELDTYTSGNELIKQMEKIKGLDILILDIDMPGIDGISAAERLMDGNVNIIFATNHQELVFEAIHSRPFRFIRKERLKEELEEAITAAVEKISRETLLYDFGTGRESYKLRLMDVDYLESKGHYLQLHTGERITQIRGKISDYENRLKDYGFIRIHQGFLVNVRSIYSINSREVTLDDGSKLPISRKKVDDIKATHAAYVRRFIRGVD